MPARSCHASSLWLLSLPEVGQLALESDEYTHTIEDSPGDEYKPGEDEAVETESDVEIGFSL